MYLEYGDLSRLFKDVSGIKNVNLEFYTVSIFAAGKQPKGLFIPLNSSAGDLQSAIANGAIAAIWEKGKNIPKYTPNHFPIFYADELLPSVRKILFLYKEKLNKAQYEKKDKTKFLFLDEKLLNDFYETYDNAVIVANLLKMLEKIREENE